MIHDDIEPALVGVIGDRPGRNPNFRGSLKWIGLPVADASVSSSGGHAAAGRSLGELCPG